MKRVYVGSTHILSPLGNGTEANFDAINDYKSGITCVIDIDLCAEQFTVSRFTQNIEGPAELTKLERMFSLVVGSVATKSGVDLASPRLGLIISTTKGNIDLLVNEDDLQLALLPNMAQRIADYIGLQSKPIVISNACISGVSATIVASRLIRAGVYDNVIVAGGDLISKFVTTGFLSFKSVSKQPCRPYDASRDGLSLGEGCAAMLLTANSDLSTGVVVEGGAVTNDANHISGPSRTGDALAVAMLQAMQQNQLSVNDISFVNAHGTATVYNDEMESKAVVLAGLSNVPINSLKPYLGHTLGASGVIEIILCVEELKRGKLFGTMGFEQLGTPMPLCVSATHQNIDMSRCVKTASGFGGCNAAVVLSLEKSAKPLDDVVYPKLSTSASCIIKNGHIECGNYTFDADGDFASFIRAAQKQLGEQNMKFFKMDNLCKLGYVAAAHLLSQTSYKPSEVALIIANKSASLDTDLKHQEILNQVPNVPASPAVFVYTLPNVVMGEICIRHKIQGENTFFVQSDFDNEMLCNYAGIVLAHGLHRAAIVGWCEILGEKYELNLSLMTK